MANCSSCGVFNEDSAGFCIECGKPMSTISTRNRATNINSSKKDEIELNIDLSFIKDLSNNQKYIAILSICILVAFFMPFVSPSKQSLFDFGGYFWIVFFLPILFFVNQYYYNQVKPSFYNKGIGQLVMIILSSMILSLYGASYFGMDKLNQFFGFISAYSSLSYSIGFVISLIGFIGILVISSIEILNLLKKIRQ